MVKTYKLELFPEKEHILYLPTGWNSGLDHMPQIAVLGTNRQKMICKRHPNGRNIIGVSTALARELKLPDKVSSLSLFMKDESLYLGVLIGIFTSGFTTFTLSPIGERSYFFRKLLSVQSSLGVIPFIFGERHIDWESGLIKGFFHFGEGWETLNVPFPNVIYDRLPNRRSEKRKTYKEIKERLQREYGIPWYNPGFFNKLDLFERLESDGSVSRYLPETHSFQSFDEIERMLAQYKHVYIKPKNGSLGNGIHKLTFDRGAEDYYCRYRDKDGKNRLVRFSSLERLMNSVFKNRSLDHFLIQQGISLVTEDSRPLDFRVHTNKDDEGNWQVSALAGKVAGIGSVTSHANNGGVVKSLSELFPDPARKDEVEESLKNAALELSSAIERNMEGYIGEIGFDLGMDEDGMIWMFEANSKPGRAIFSHPELKSFDILTRKLALSFGVFLSQHALNHPEEMMP
ncbi:YheC/YheD family protein [Rossellomorea aquimaris]|uniref:YheC/YheD family endospore coat-associated protein n=1 Tax=Rossellomorea aquimaris TaxID=189382 RepID=UPI001CD56A68|nr:YheC/YheD family protein [Rossellomorea aquimaris]MCA1056496.1 YheC/YheD family protein [Rossellomorea aquimaris]